MLPMAKPSPSYAGSKELKALGGAIRDLRLYNLKQYLVTLR